MQKAPELQPYKYLAAFFVIALVMIACAIGGQSAQSPESGSPAGQQATALPEETQGVNQAVNPLQVYDDGILFEDDFQDGQPDNWKISSAWNVHQAGDIYNFGAASKGGAWVPAGYNWSDYTFETDAVVQDGSLILSFDFTNSGRYMLHLREDGLFLVKEQPAGDFNVLAHTGPVQSGQWHRIAVNTKDGRIQVLVDGDMWIDISDGQPLATGTIALSILDGSQASVDNVLVSQLSEPLEDARIVAPPPIADSGAVEDELEEISVVIPIEIIEPVAGPVLAPPQEAPEEQDAPPPVEVPSQEEEPPAQVVPEEDEEPPPAVVPVEQDQVESDLSIVKVEIPPSVNQSAPFSVGVTIHNAGPDAAVPYTLVWYPEGLAYIGCSWDIYNHLPGTENRRTVTCQFPGYPSAGTFTWIVQADPEGAANDFALGGNERTGMIIVRPK